VSLKQIYAENGVEFALPINQLWESWPMVMRRAETKGIRARPVRIGTRRVVLAVDSQIKSTYKFFFVLPALMIIVLLCGYLASINTAVTQGDHVQKSAYSCPALHSGDSLTPLGSAYSSQNWNLALQSIGASGNLQLFKFSANCGKEKLAGTLLVTSDKNGLSIKKLTPTEK
jgi:hypothetical protein